MLLAQSRRAIVGICLAVGIALPLFIGSGHRLSTRTADQDVTLQAANAAQSWARDDGARRQPVKPAHASLPFDTLLSGFEEVMNVGKISTGTTSVGSGATTETTVAMPEAPAASDAADKTRQGRNLVAEDNDTDLRVLDTILQSSGFSLAMDNNGQEAAKALESFRPDIIWMNVAMSVRGGFDATAEIHEIEASNGRHTPTIGVTAHAISGGRKRYPAASMDDYVSKPVKKDVLIETLARWPRFRTDTARVA